MTAFAPIAATPISSTPFAAAPVEYVQSIVGAPWGTAADARVSAESRWHDGTTEESITTTLWHDCTTEGSNTTTRWQDGVLVDAATGLPWRDAATVNGLPTRSPWQDAATVNGLPNRMPWRDTVNVIGMRALPWRDAALLEALKSFPWQQGSDLTAFGSPLDPFPPLDICYLPNGDLVFSEAPAADGKLLFFCELHPPVNHHYGGPTHVVPVRKVYIVLNSVNLIRTADGRVLPTLSLSLTIDAASWTWGFSATLPGSELEYVTPDSDGTPVELEATINGTSYRVLAESMGTDRSFGRKDLKIGGRGKNAVLDAPYAQSLSFGNATADRTAAQLMDDALMLNGVSIGWTVDFGLDDWLVTAGAWAHQGTHITAVSAIAAAAGGYVQPHRTADTLRILARYPVLPRDWATDVTPDFELPAAVTEKEAIEWVEKVRYNRVFVSGQGQGILGQVTLTGSDGGIVSPLVVDPLITDVIAARQRGTSILGDTGRVANVTLRLPVLAETGIIEPGKFVKYVDGGTERLGIVRSTQVDAAGQADVWQALVIETHE